MSIYYLPAKMSIRYLPSPHRVKNGERNINLAIALAPKGLDWTGTPERHIQSNPNPSEVSKQLDMNMIECLPASREKEGISRHCPLVFPLGAAGIKMNV